MEFAKQGALRGTNRGHPGHPSRCAGRTAHHRRHALGAKGNRAHAGRYAFQGTCRSDRRHAETDSRQGHGRRRGGAVPADCSHSNSRHRLARSAGHRRHRRQRDCDDPAAGRAPCGGHGPVRTGEGRTLRQPGGSVRPRRRGAPETGRCCDSTSDPIRANRGSESGRSGSRTHHRGPRGEQGTPRGCSREHR